MKVKDLPYIDEDEIHEDRPEYKLLIAILDRALRDLDHEERYIRNESLAWFRVWENQLPVGVSYKDVRDNIDLTNDRIKFIEKKIKKATPSEFENIIIIKKKFSWHGAMLNRRIM